MSNKGLMPKKLIDVTLEYNCNKCGCQRWLTGREVEVPGFKFICNSCNTINEIEHVKLKFTVTPVIKTVNKTTKHTNINTDLVNHVVNILRTYDYTKQDAEKLVNHTYIVMTDNGINITKETLLKESFIGAN